MKGINRIVNTSFWNDSKITEYFTPEDKYFMLYLLTNPHTTQLGIYEFPIKTVSFELGYSIETVIGLIDRFQNKYGMIVYSSETKEILIKNFLRHSIVKGGKPVMDCLKKEEKTIKDKTLLGYLYKYLDDYRDELNITVIEYIDTLQKYVSYEKEKGKDKDNYIDNDNDNERIVPRIVPRIVNDDEKAPKKVKEVKIVFGEYQNVKLTQAEYDRLANDYTAETRDRCIEFLDSYIEEKGYKSKSHNLAIRRWVVDAVNKKNGSSNNQRNLIDELWECD